MTRRPFSLLLSILLLIGCSAWAAVAGHVQGVAIDDKVLVDGLPAVLNGAGLKQRFGLDTDVMALYLPRKVHGLAAATALDGAKRLRFVMLVPLKGRQLERTFTQSATRTLTPLELGALTDDIMAIGRAYDKLGDVKPGDVIDIDWTPGLGLGATINGRPLLLGERGGRSQERLANPLLFGVLLRVYLETDRPGEFLDNMLGLSSSMLRTRELSR